jgi:hypothetical protein
MALAHDLDLLPLVMVVGNLVRLSLAAPALAACTDLSESALPYPPPLPPPQGGRGIPTHGENCPSPLEGEGREGGEARRRPVLAPPHLAWRGAP